MPHSVRPIMTALFSPYLSSLTLQQDIPLYILIPESISPTLALKNGGTFHLTTLPGRSSFDLQAHECIIYYLSYIT